MESSILSSCTSGGCGAKVGPGELSAILAGLPGGRDPNLLVGFDASDDAAVYRLDDGRAMISTVDFFSPMVEDARTFGRIAAANALSDIYAMGGAPALALNLVCFPQTLPTSLLGDILRGGAEKIAEAGATLGGGHSIYDKELKYGLAVTGFVEMEHLVRNNTPAPGHQLILTKPLGVGIVMAAARGGVAEDSAIKQAIASMERLNRYAAEKMRGFRVSACTDVTGFGLLGHLLEMCGDTVSAELRWSKLPHIPEALHYAGEYLLTAAGQRNRNHLEGRVDTDELPFPVQELLYDPQTSGGLLICVDSGQAEELLQRIRQDDPLAEIVGTIQPRRSASIRFRT